MKDGNDLKIPASDVDAVLDRSIDLQAASDDDDGGVSLSELQDAAGEAGIPPEFVREAAFEVASRRVRRRRLTGLLGLGLCGLVLWAAGASLLSNDETEEQETSRESALVSTPTLAPAPAPVPAPQGLGEADAERVEPPPRPRSDDPLLTGEAAEVARRAVQGSWQLVSWVTTGEMETEIPTRQRADDEPSAELWDFAAGGRFRRTIGSDFAMGGRWAVIRALAAPVSLRWLGVETWWLVALDGVQIASLPTERRAREFAVVGQDGEERIIIYLGREASVGETVTGGRCVRGRPEGARR